jgi:putative methyltransferase
MTRVTERDWYAWHHDYDHPATALARRLAAVQERIRVTLDTAPTGPLRAISMCAGQGRDLIGALAGHPRRHDVRARLVEIDPRNADVARQAAQAAGLPQVEVVTGDAALTDAYAGLAPAGLVLVCGVFGNITDADIERTVGYCTQLCAPGGTVVWTRGRWAPDLLPRICDWFAGRGFDELWVSDPAEGWGAAAHRFAGPPAPLEPGGRMFTFRGHHPRTGPLRYLCRTGGGARHPFGTCLPRLTPRTPGSRPVDPFADNRQTGGPTIRSPGAGPRTGSGSGFGVDVAAAKAQNR